MEIKLYLPTDIFIFSNPSKCLFSRATVIMPFDEFLSNYSDKEGLHLAIVGQCKRYLYNFIIYKSNSMVLNFDE